MLNRAVHRCTRLVCRPPRFFWILLLLLFLIFEVYILWPSASRGWAAAVERRAPQTLQSQLPLAVIAALNQKWTPIDLRLVPAADCGGEREVTGGGGACQCDKDQIDGKSAVAWTVNQNEHRAGITTRVFLPWLPDAPGTAVQCVFGDRIVKGHLINEHSADASARQAGAAAACVLSALTSESIQISCVAPPRYHVVQPGESLYSIAVLHGLSHTM
jgi:hypothetical protein